MARNRKRAKERRSRRPTAQVSRPGVATARAEREARDAERGRLEDRREGTDAERDGLEDRREGLGAKRDGLDETPSPIEHATPDDEQPDDSRAARSGEAGGRAGGKREGWREDAQLAVGPEMAAVPEPDEPEPELESDDDADLVDGAGAVGGELAASGASAPAPRKLSGNRLINFLQGSWRELQRVQWPDRRQVMQATGVVIGFVIVAGVFLGVADTLAGKVVTLILK